MECGGWKEDAITSEGGNIEISNWLDQRIGAQPSLRGGSRLRNLDSLQNSISVNNRSQRSYPTAKPVLKGDLPK
jgi:hypothetical protein